MDTRKQHKPNSLRPEMMLCEALKEKGFTLVEQPDPSNQCTKMDFRLTVEIGGAATSTVDATYEMYDVTAAHPYVSLDDLRTLIGSTIVLLSVGSVEPLAPAGCTPYSHCILRDCFFQRGKEEPKRNIQTTYLAMQGIYQDLPPFSKLTLDQRKMIRNHVEMLADYLRK